MNIENGQRSKAHIPIAIRMFNNCDSRTNGEHQFFTKIRDHIDIVFDVGCRTDSEYVAFQGEVHYFDPIPSYIQTLSSQPNLNRRYVFNECGLGKENKQVYYYPRFQSCLDRVKSCQVSDDVNKIVCHIRNAKSYMIEHELTHIDFLKIDTEGYELEVLQGFEDYLNRVNIIQFEYGGTFLDSGVTLRDIMQYLQAHGFEGFSYLTAEGPVPITDDTDHYQYCNIVCVNKNSPLSHILKK